MSSLTTMAESRDRKYSVYVATRTNMFVLAFAAIVVVILVLFPLFGPTMWTRRLVDFFSYLALAEMWNLMLGYAGLISVGQQGFIGIGAYTLWLFSDHLGIDPLASAVFAAIGGAIIALPAAALVFRLRGGYLAIGTWVIAEIMRLIVANIKRAGGNSGITIQKVSEAVQSLGTDVWYSRVYWWALGAALIAIGVTYFLLRSRTGLALKAMRDNDLAAESSGVNLWRTKLYTYVIAGAGCALVGAIQAMYTLRVHPGSAFSVNWTAYLIFITIIGGVGTIEGPIIGTIVFYVLRETTSDFGTWYFIALGVLAIIVTIWSPAGVYGWVLRRTNFMLFPLQRKVRFLGEYSGEGVTQMVEAGSSAAGLPSSEVDPSEG